MTPTAPATARRKGHTAPRRYMETPKGNLTL